MFTNQVNFSRPLSRCYLAVSVPGPTITPSHPWQDVWCPENKLNIVLLSTHWPTLARLVFLSQCDNVAAKNQRAFLLRLVVPWEVVVMPNLLDVFILFHAFINPVIAWHALLRFVDAGRLAFPSVLCYLILSPPNITDTWDKLPSLYSSTGSIVPSCLQSLTAVNAVS